MQIKPLGIYFQVKGVEDKRKSAILVISGNSSGYSHYEVLAIPAGEKEIKKGSKILLDSYGVREIGDYFFVQRESIIAII